MHVFIIYFYSRFSLGLSHIIRLFQKHFCFFYKPLLFSLFHDHLWLHYYMRIGWKVHMIMSYLLLTFLTNRIQVQLHWWKKRVDCKRDKTASWSHSIRVFWSAYELFSWPSDISTLCLSLVSSHGIYLYMYTSLFKVVSPSLVFLTNPQDSSWF